MASTMLTRTLMGLRSIRPSIAFTQKPQIYSSFVNKTFYRRIDFPPLSSASCGLARFATSSNLGAKATFVTESVSTKDPIVSVDWLHANLQEPDVKVLDASWYMPDEQRNPIQEYQVAHIPGALFFDVNGISDRSSKTVLNRVNTFTNLTYKDDPTIFAWELMNEPRCPSDPSGDTLQDWIQEMAVYVKSLDPNHLVEIGLEGFYGSSTPGRVQFNPNTYSQQLGTDFIRNHKALGVDFASVHIYADSWISQPISDAHLQFVKSWMEAHIEDAEKTLGMPVVFGEFGVSARDTGYNASFRDTLISTIYNTLLASIKKGGSGGGSLFWQLFPDGTSYMDDGYAIVLSKSKSTSNIISLQSTRLMLFNSLCSMRCHWGCRKKNALDGFLYSEE